MGKQPLPHFCFFFVMEYDALIIGGGPAGSSSAAILAEYGHRVLVVEREKFPRYHIGESLIPFTFQPLERIGMLPKMRASHFVKKYSVTFVQPHGTRSQPFYFYDRYDKETVAQTWQVLRSEFDQMLLDNAREKGAEVREETTVLELLNEHGRVAGAKVTNKAGEVSGIRAKITLDCTGKEAFSSNRRGWRKGDPYLNKVAVWTYYKGSKREAGIDEGATTVAYVPEKGWFWHIPQHNDMVSIGVVAEGKYLTRDGVRDPKGIFDREIHENQWVRDHLAVGEQTGGYFITSEYSRHSQYCAAPGLLLAGDALAFLDPVFSSGVMLALKCGVLAGDEVHKGLVEGDLSPGRFAEYGATIRAGVENMRKLVYAFYDPNFSFREVIKKYPDAAGTITDCLSGDVNKDFSELWAQIREFVPLPDDLPYGEPLLEEEPPLADRLTSQTTAKKSKMPAAPMAI
jgi:flavin-dependent dehydrogenase